MWKLWECVERLWGLAEEEGGSGERLNTEYISLLSKQVGVTFCQVFRNKQNVILCVNYTGGSGECSACLLQGGRARRRKTECCETALQVLLHVTVDNTH